MLLHIIVAKRMLRKVGEKKERIRQTVKLNGEVIYCFESEPYGLSLEDVVKVTEERLNTLRLALKASSVDTVVIRETE